ncbi:hypothetical protein [Methylophaga sp. OBS4]|uniref:hypothetical protein n=1 Tax=Methylophaga sp. OBS4 TaxID=2991935 RepID=UPI002254B7B9|nr:hypothetical protein [Methylophaga sp. OBS4]MCX4186737.1 hypothetical protein [Methylophaga sp. OBS4]
MKERPIIFNADMVRAILDGRKTQTRRPMKLQPGKVTDSGRPLFYEHGVHGRRVSPKFPFGQPGDRLWVRETCKAEELESGLDGVRYAADLAFVPIKDSKQAAEDWLILSTYRKKKNQHGQSNTVPSIHMPRWASRILLEITDVRVQRLQDVSKDDAKAEGWRSCVTNPGDMPPLFWFHAIFEDIYGAELCDKNPWVWAVEFKRIEADA